MLSTKPAEITELPSVCVCVASTVSTLCSCLCVPTFRSELSSHSYFDAVALRFLPHRTKEWQREDS